jgi:hypothetical protein
LKAMQTPTIAIAAKVGSILGMAFPRGMKTYPAFQPYTTPGARQAPSIDLEKVFCQTGNSETD